MRDLTELEARVIGECLRAAVEGPFFVWFRKVEDPTDPAADAAWKALSPRHRVGSRERIERLGEEDWKEFALIFRASRDEVAAIAVAWSDVRDGTDVERAANNAMNNLLGYPHRCYEVWGDYISVSPIELRKIYRNWRKECSKLGPLPQSRSAGEEYFFGLTSGG